MDTAFWLNKWTSNQIGFHEKHPHPLLVRYWERLTRCPRSKVFVPLCGKSNDLIWLKEQGHKVVGVEVSEIAVSDFFYEQNLTPEITIESSLTRFTSESYVLYCGDYFNLRPSDVGDFSLVYDRASLIALSPDTRARYVEKLSDFSRTGTQKLLVALEYDTEIVNPPPYAVTAQEIHNLYEPLWRIEKVGVHDTDVKGHAGQEIVYIITRK